MELQHHGIKGMKWGRRRFQNDDGSLTSAGRLRYGDDRGPKRPLGARTDGYSKTKKPPMGSKLNERIKARQKHDREMEKKMGTTRYTLDKSFYGKKGVERIQKRHEEKGMSYRKAERREFGRQYAQGLLKTIGVITVAGLASSAVRRRQEIRGKQYANRNLMRLPAKGFAWDVVASAGSGIDVLKKA